jgi:hypothetical protein
MTHRSLFAAIACIALTPLASCSPITEEMRQARKFDVKVTVDKTVDPMRIRFDLYRTPYADDQDHRLPVYEQIRLGMRKFATEQLAERGLCPHGFRGPDSVAGSSNDMQHKFFHVTCLPALVKASAPATEAEAKPSSPASK